MPSLVTYNRLTVFGEPPWRWWADPEEASREVWALHHAYAARFGEKICFSLSHHIHRRDGVTDIIVSYIGAEFITVTVSFFFFDLILVGGSSGGFGLKGQDMHGRR